MQLTGKNKFNAYLVAIGYLLISLFFLKWFSDIMDADYFAYMSIARKYNRGLWYYAINDYWSPGISWLMAAGYFISSNEMAVIKILKIIFGTVSIFYTYRIMELLQIRFKVFYSIVFAFPIFYFQYLNQTADSFGFMLMIGFLYFNILNKNRQDIRFILLYSIFIAVLFFAKYYNLYFVFLLTPFIFLYKNDLSIKAVLKPKKMLDIIKIYSLSFLFILPWVIANYTKTHHFVITSSSEHNLNLVGPKNGKVQPFFKSDLIELPDQYSFSPLDYLPYKAHLEKYSFFSSKENFKYFLWYSKGQVRNFLEAIEAELLILVVLLILTFAVKNKPDKNLLLFLLLFASIYPVGYFLTYIVPRYLMIVNFLLLLCSVVLLNSFLFSKKLKTPVIFMLMGLSGLVIVYSYMQQIMLINSYNGLYRKLWEDGKKDIGDITGGNVAIYGNGIGEMLSSDAMSVAYLGNGTFWGQVNIKNYKSNAQLSKKLMEYNIKVYFTPKDIPIYPDSVNYKLTGIEDGMKIFRRITQN